MRTVTDHIVAGDSAPQLTITVLDEPGQEEALLAIVIDRLRAFEAGPFASFHNASALAHCELALGWLQRERIARGVEGTNQK